jgi:hypothetical protein
MPAMHSNGGRWGTAGDAMLLRWLATHPKAGDHSVQPDGPPQQQPQGVPAQSVPHGGRATGPASTLSSISSLLVVGLVLPMTQAFATAAIPTQLQPLLKLAWVALVPVAILAIALQLRERRLQAAGGPPMVSDVGVWHPPRVRARAPATVLSAGWFFILAGALQLAGTVLSFRSLDVLVDLIGMSSEAAGNPPAQSRAELQSITMVGLVVGIAYLGVGLLYAAGRAVPRAVAPIVSVGSVCACCTGPAMSLIVASQLSTETERADLQQRMGEALPSWFEPVLGLGLLGRWASLAFAVVLLFSGASGDFFRAASAR